MYITTNLINNKYYIGVHVTNKIDDGYLCSGKALKRSIKKHGKEFFKREIIKFFTNKQDMFAFENLIINMDVTNDINSYNIAPGGSGGYRNISKEGKIRISNSRKNKVVVKDLENNILCVDRDVFLKNSALVGNTKGKILVKDKDNNFMSVDKDDKRLLNGILSPSTKGFVLAMDTATNKKVMVSTEDFYSDSKYVGHTFGCVQTKEANIKRSLALKGLQKPKRAVAVCPFCNKIVDVANLKRWHLNNCKYYKQIE
jgi:hypothetical protein